ncbi:MAG: metal ABC transporter ATP-binding protein [Desulfobacteraceae bacterium]|nr:metal ABC transporter ATP-binding protein [Desulfobacteraceae bacterium]
MLNKSIVELKNVDFSYNGQPVLEQVNLTIRKDDFMAVIGPNGGGKTTLLKLILGLMSPDGGTIDVMGGLPRKASSAIGYVPQNVHINNNFPITAMDVVLMGKLRVGNRWKKNAGKDRDEAIKILGRLDMEPHAYKKIGELSGGQRQRVFIARALMTQPQLLLLDEPTASIDTKGQAEFFRLLKQLNKKVAILVVSHDLFVVSNYVKSVACVNKGLHYHPHEEITGDMLETMYSCSVEDICRVQVLAHGLPKKTLKGSGEKTNGNF